MVRSLSKRGLEHVYQPAGKGCGGQRVTLYSTTEYNVVRVKHGPAGFR